MRNFSIKLALLAATINGDERPDSQAYLDLSPSDALRQYKDCLTEADRGVIMFGFSDQALLDILDEEFEVQVESNALVFRKPYLDARSIRLAGGGRASTDIADFTRKEQTLIRNLAVWLFDATRPLYRDDLSEARIRDIQAEYEENVRIYACKCVSSYEPGEAELLLRSLFGSVKAMNAFSHSLTVDAMFKADAARVIFGEESGYYQAWFRKQMFRHMMAKAVDRFIGSYAS